MIDEVRYWLLSPLHLLRIGDEPGRGGSAPIGHAFVAVPFITGVLALRNYAKRSHPDRN